jgi:hypothetical protein
MRGNVRRGRGTSRRRAGGAATGGGAGRTRRPPTPRTPRVPPAPSRWPRPPLSTLQARNGRIVQCYTSTRSIGRGDNGGAVVAGVLAAGHTYIYGMLCPALVRWLNWEDERSRWASGGGDRGLGEGEWGGSEEEEEVEPETAGIAGACRSRRQFSLFQTEGQRRKSVGICTGS